LMSATVVVAEMYIDLSPRPPQCTTSRIFAATAEVWCSGRGRRGAV
jgi:hypothetical protein